MSGREDIAVLDAARSCSIEEKWKAFEAQSFQLCFCTADGDTILRSCAASTIGPTSFSADPCAVYLGVEKILILDFVGLLSVANGNLAADVVPASAVWNFLIPCLKLLMELVIFTAGFTLIDSFFFDDTVVAPCTGIFCSTSSVDVSLPAAVVSGRWSGIPALLINFQYQAGFITAGLEHVNFSCLYIS